MTERVPVLPDRPDDPDRPNYVRSACIVVSPLRSRFVMLAGVRCSICRHPRRVAIEAAISSVSDIDVVADIAGLSARALRSHLATHARACVAPSSAPEADDEAPSTSRCPELPPSRSKLATVLDALEEHPKARAAAIAALERAEKAHAA